MYIHLGDNVCVNSDDVIGIFDIENTSTGESTKQFLRYAGETGSVVAVSYEMPKSFVVCTGIDNKEIIYISRISAAVLRKRAERIPEYRIGGFDYGCKPEL